MIAQWKNKYISDTVCPLGVPGHDSSVEEQIHLRYCLSSLLPGFNSRLWQSISRDFSLADHTLPTRPEPAWQKMAQSPLNGTTQHVETEEGQSSTTGTPWLRLKIGWRCNLMNLFKPEAWWIGKSSESCEELILTVGTQPNLGTFNLKLSARAIELLPSDASFSQHWFRASSS